MNEWSSNMNDERNEFPWDFIHFLWFSNKRDVTDQPKDRGSYRAMVHLKMSLEFCVSSFQNQICGSILENGRSCSGIPASTCYTVVQRSNSLKFQSESWFKQSYNYFTGNYLQKSTNKDFLSASRDDDLVLKKVPGRTFNRFHLY